MSKITKMLSASVISVLSITMLLTPTASATAGVGDTDAPTLTTGLTGSSITSGSLLNGLPSLPSNPSTVLPGLPDLSGLPSLPSNPSTVIPGLPDLNGLPGSVLPGGVLPGEKRVDKPFLKGYPDGQFHPNSPLTRSEAATIVAKVKELPLDEAPIKNYQDVPQEHWAYRYIKSVTKSGYMQGYGDGSFQPNKPISRAELITLILHVRGVAPVPDLSGFPDTGNHWAKDFIATAKQLGFVSGSGTEPFLPDLAAQRQEAAVLFCIAFVRGPLVDGDIPVKQHFPDVMRNDWAFKWIEEAAVEAHESVRDQTQTQEKLIRYRQDVPIFE